MGDNKYSDMITMQNEAKKRVIEMQKRSKFAADNFNASQGLKREPAKEEELPCIAKSISYPTEITKNARMHKAECMQNCEHTGNIRQLMRNIFGNITGGDSEKLLIMSLCLLLAEEENADDSLIVALMYLLS